MVMEYAKDGSLRQYLNNMIFYSIKWGDKLNILHRIANGLNSIHKEGLIHRDFHSGNMLKDGDFTIITDCQPANVKTSQNEYENKASSDIAHDKILAISICQGLRPKSNYKIPQLILDIIKQCLDADPLKRPKSKELYDLLLDLHRELETLYDEFYYDRIDNSEVKKQFEEAERINEKLTSTSLSYNGTTLSYTTNPQAVYTSRLLNFKNLPEPKNSIDNKDDDNSIREYSEPIEAIDFTKLN
ncbi:uncharacterized protein OCT59_015962 [Rhizophagus irregularis]|nr:hypothetical protein OCT59_015962 [Rhizophagus irregularis]